MNYVSHPEKYFYRTNLLLAVLTAAACFLFTYLYFDFYYVDYEALFDSFYSGQLTGGMPFRSIYFLANIGTSHIYSLLYQLMPQVEWISWILYSYMFLSCIICFYIVIDTLPRSLVLWAKIALLTCIYFVVFADHNIQFVFTRVSYMTTGFSLLGLLHFFGRSNTIRKRPLLFVFFNLFFVIGVLTRSESGTAALAQIIFFGFFYVKEIKRFITIFLFPCVFVLSVLLAIAYNIKTATEFYKQIEPDVEAQFCQRDNMVALACMKTNRDSVMWRAARDICWMDPQVLTPAYLRSLIKPEKLIYTDYTQWKRVYADDAEIIIKYWYLCLIALLLTIICGLQVKFISRSDFLRWLVFAASFWVLLIFQTYTWKVNDRSFSPPICLFIFCNIITLLPYLGRVVWRLVYSLYAGLVFLFIVSCYHLKIEANQLRADLTDYRKNQKTITALARNKILVINSTSCDYIFSANKPFHPFNYSAFKKIYITDGYNMPFLPYYRRYLESECHCDMYAFPAFWDYLRTKHGEVLIVSDLDRMNILKNYMKAIHGYDLPVVQDTSIELLPLEKSDEQGTFANLKVYSLGS